MTDMQTSDWEVKRAIRSWLHEDRHEDASRVAGAVLDQVEATPQRRATWWPAWRMTAMNRALGFGLAAAAVVVVLIVGAQLFGSSGNAGAGAGPTATPEPTATPAPTATPEPSPSVAAGLPEGPHVLLDESGLVVDVSIAAPRWNGEPQGGILCWGDPADECSGPPDGAGIITFVSREYYVYGDPCEWSTTTPGTPATTVDELVDALTNQASRAALALEDITVDGRPGKKVILHMNDDVVDFNACDEDEGEPRFGLFGVPPYELSRYSQGPGQIEELWIVDVDGPLLAVLDGTYYADTPQNAVDELRAILASANFR